MRTKQVVALTFLLQVAFGLFFFGACVLLNDNAKGWIFEGVAFLIAIPVVILLNRREKDR